jgi:alginate O-acetyltransferase complex protein AlgI
MAFSSVRFFVFLLALLLLLSLIPSNLWRKRALCIASCLFYAAWDYRYLGLLLLISGIDFVAAARIDQTELLSRRRAWMVFSIVTNLGCLAYFKYTDFFIHSLNGILGNYGREIPLLHIFLPAGISFYTFKSMSYTIDVYRRELRPCRTLMEYAMFVSFFPDLIAGPIVRASVFLPQLDHAIGATRTRLQEGGSLFMVGLGKKLLIADQVGPIADAVFQNPGAWSCGMAWTGLIAYTLQIYCDFSGYSDMAIGTAQMLGYDLPENFRMPYLSGNVSEFWQRWHITLSQWLRDYLYIPLGGNRKGPSRTYVNLFLTMLLGGLWHGAGWNFVLWGVLHGAALSIHRGWNRLGFRMPRLAGQFLTLLFVSLAWVPFRATDAATTRSMLMRLFTPGSGGNHWLPVVVVAALILVVAGHLAGLWIERGETDTGAIPRLFDVRVREHPLSGRQLVFGMITLRGAFITTSILLIIAFFGATNASPFIYFRF